MRTGTVIGVSKSRAVDQRNAHTEGDGAGAQPTIGLTS